MNANERKALMNLEKALEACREIFGGFGYATVTVANEVWDGAPPAYEATNCRDDLGRLHLQKRHADVTLFPEEGVRYRTEHPAYAEVVLPEKVMA